MQENVMNMGCMSPLNKPYEMLDVNVYISIRGICFSGTVELKGRLDMWLGPVLWTWYCYITDFVEIHENTIVSILFVAAVLFHCSSVPYEPREDRVQPYLTLSLTSLSQRPSSVPLFLSPVWTAGGSRTTWPNLTALSPRPPMFMDAFYDQDKHLSEHAPR